MNLPSSAVPNLDFTKCMTILCHDFAQRVPDLNHIDLDRVLVTVSKTRKNVPHGLYAAVTPLRFPGRSLTGRFRGQSMAMPIVRNSDGVQQYYIMTFYVPRFLKIPLSEKLETVAHELWHISPDFDGTIRRFGMKNRVHGPSQAEYDSQVRTLVDQYLANKPKATAYSFLSYGLSELGRRYGSITGLQITHPKLIPIPA